MSRGRDRGGDAGLTLVELVVAMAIFAMVSVMGLQGITGMMRMRDRLETQADATRDLARAVALLRADLGAVVPLPFFPPGGAAPEPAVQASRGGLAISVGGQPGLGNDPAPGFARIVWRVDPVSGRLLRQGWTRLTPADDRAELPEVTVMTAVRSLSLRSYLGPTQGWRPGVPAAVQPVQGDAAVAPSDTAARGALPLAVELTLDTETFGTVTMIESLQ